MDLLLSLLVRTPPYFALQIHSAPADGVPSYIQQYELIGIHSARLLPLNGLA